MPVRWAVFLAVTMWTTAVAFTAAVAVFTLGFCYFIGDDFSTMWRLAVRPLSEVIWIPLGGQVVPLHRVVAAAVHAIAPASFALAWSVLLGWHLLALVILYRLLVLLRRSPVNLPLFALYAIHPLWGVHLAWFSSGLTRLPYIALSLVALHAWVRHRNDPRARHPAVAALAFVASLGFYSKGILTPLFCVTIDLLLDFLRGPADTPAPARRARFACAGGMVALSVVYVLAARSFLDSNEVRTNLDPLFQIQYQYYTWIIGAHAALGRILEFKTYSPTWVVFGAFALAVWLTGWLNRRALAGWGVLVFLVSASYGVVGATNRAVTYGALMAFEHRYHFEVLFVAVVCLAIIGHASEDALRDRLRARREWATAARAGTALTLALIGTRGYLDFQRTTSEVYADEPRAERLVSQLLSGVRALERAHPDAVILDSEFPRYLDYMDGELRYYSQLVPALGENPRFGNERVATHRIDSEGRLQRTALPSGTESPERSR